jgi:hypothetical protein
VASLKNKIILILLHVIPFLSFAQTWTYTFTNPCTLTQQTITNNIGESVALNYFGNVQTFTENDFNNGIFDNWINSVTQINSSSPCESITEGIINNTNSTVVATTLAVVTNIMSALGGNMLPPAESINNSSNGNDSEEEDQGEENIEANGINTNKGGSSNTTQTNKSNQETKGGEPSSQTSGERNTETTGGSSDTNKSTKTGKRKTESTVEEEKGSTQSLANSLANAISGGNNEQSNEAGKNAGSLIASGDVVVISNQDNSNGQQFRFVGSVTHSNTDDNRIKGALITYTSGTNDASVTLYKSWINPKKTFNLVLANTTLTNFTSNVTNTTTALESFKFGKRKKFTGMAGLNYTYGKLGKRNLQNLSSIAGVHRNFKVSPRITTSLLMLGVYSPFTQYYEGAWFDAGVLVVPFSSWDIKITKTFKYNISFTGVWQTSGSALNYQILTGGKLNF